jgi:hypothetical protein
MMRWESRVGLWVLYIYIYTYLYIYIYTHLCIFIHIHIYKHIYTKDEMSVESRSVGTIGEAPVYAFNVRIRSRKTIKEQDQRVREEVIFSYVYLYVFYVYVQL